MTKFVNREQKTAIKAVLFIKFIILLSKLFYVCSTVR